MERSFRRNIPLAFLVLFLLPIVISGCNESIEVNTEEVTKETKHPEPEAIESDCSDLDFFTGRNYYRSGLMDELDQNTKKVDLATFEESKESVKHLDLSRSGFSKLPDALFEFKSLEYLDISGNIFKDKEKLFEDLSRLPKLRILDASSCDLRSLPSSIKLLPNLEAIVLDRNNIRVLSEDLGALTKLKLLSLSSNGRLTNLPASIGNLKCLQYLNVSSTRLTRLRNELAFCTELVAITGNASWIKTLPDSIGNLKKMRYINLGYCRLESLPNSIGGMRSLENLSLGSNELLSVPESIAKLNNLERLSLDFNRLSEFPEPILRLPNVYSIWLHNNSFPKIPLDVAKMPNLKEILVDHEIITDENIFSLKALNPELKIIRNDSQRYVKGRKRKT